MNWTIIAVLFSLGFGYVSRWVQDWKRRRDYKRAVEAEYREKIRETIYKAIEEYENEKKNIEDMPRSERMRYIADRVS